MSYLCLIHSLATILWLISLVSLSRPAAPETRRLLGKNKPNPWTPHPPGLLDYINIFSTVINALIYAYAAYNHYTLICLIPGWTVRGLFPSPPTTTSARPTSCRLNRKVLSQDLITLMIENDFDKGKYWSGMVEHWCSTLWQLSVLVGKLLDPKSGAEPRSPDHNYHYLLYRKR